MAVNYTRKSLLNLSLTFVAEHQSSFYEFHKVKCRLWVALDCCIVAASLVKCIDMQNQNVYASEATGMCNTQVEMIPALGS